MQAFGFVELLAAPASKRRWLDEAKGQMDAETTVPGVTVNEVAQGEGRARIFSVPSPRDMIGGVR